MNRFLRAISQLALRQKIVLGALLVLLTWLAVCLVLVGIPGF
jgi:hypothetical protein